MANGDAKWRQAHAKDLVGLKQQIGSEPGVGETKGFKGRDYSSRVLPRPFDPHVKIDRRARIAVKSDGVAPN